MERILESRELMPMEMTTHLQNEIPEERRDIRVYAQFHGTHARTSG